MTGISHAATIGDELAIAWADGTESYLSGELLRRSCPCASCQGEPDATGRVVRPKVTYRDNSFVLTRFEPVGGYALQLFFADGHNTGIYSFSLLRSLGERS